MTKDIPIIAAKHPIKVDLEAGKDYYWCQCGKSASQPICDGSHRGTDIKPLKFTAEKSISAALCLCKASADAPYCGGSHAPLIDLILSMPSYTKIIQCIRHQHLYLKNRTCLNP